MFVLCSCSCVDPCTLQSVETMLVRLVETYPDSISDSMVDEHDTGGGNDAHAGGVVQVEVEADGQFATSSAAAVKTSATAAGADDVYYYGDGEAGEYDYNDSDQPPAGA